MKTKPRAQALLDRQLFAVPVARARRVPEAVAEARIAANRWFWLAVVLSVLLHSGIALVCWFQPLGGRDLIVIDTRFPDSRDSDIGADPDFVITFPEARPPTRPVPPTTPPPAPLTAPVLVASDSETVARMTAPLNPDFSQRLSSGRPSVESGLGGGRPGSEPAGGKNGGVSSFFRIPVRGQRIVYVIDRSSSMGETGALSLAKRELCASLDALSPQVCFQVIAYNRSVESLRLDGAGGLLPATPTNKRRAAAWMNALRAEGGTEHLPALQQALLLRPDVLFLLTDADALSEEQVRAVTRSNHGRTVIHTIEISSPVTANGLTPLQMLARDNRGLYRGVNPRAAAPRLPPSPLWAERR